MRRRPTRRHDHPWTVGSGSSDLDRNYYEFEALNDQLFADLGAADLGILLNDSQSKAIADVAQLVIETIDELAD